MTAKKDLKRRVRERMKATGERYTTALAHVLEEAPAAPPPTKRSLIERLPAPHDLSKLAKLEGFETCNAEVSERTWREVEDAEGSADAWFRSVFEKLRQLLVASIGEPGADRLRAALVHGHIDDAGPQAFSIPFFRRIDSGFRGVSADGVFATIDVVRKNGRSSLVLLWSVCSGYGERRRQRLVLQVDPDFSFVRPEKLLEAILRFRLAQR
jgi:hypothetical protein